MIAGFGFANILFLIVPFFILGCFVYVFGTLIARGVHNTKQWNQNNQSPVLIVEAEVIAKRCDIRHRHHHRNSHYASMSWYYVTFQVESGDRMEFQVQDTEYGLLVEGDRGKLTFQGTRYHSFERYR